MSQLRGRNKQEAGALPVLTLLEGNKKEGAVVETLRKGDKARLSGGGESW